MAHAVGGSASSLKYPPTARDQQDPQAGQRILRQAALPQQLPSRSAQVSLGNEQGQLKELSGRRQLSAFDVVNDGFRLTRQRGYLLATYFHIDTR